jgi:hypothetical protein
LLDKSLTIIVPSHESVNGFVIYVME